MSVPRRRGAISAESSGPSEPIEDAGPGKRQQQSASTLKYLEQVLSRNILFSHLQVEERAELFEYMTQENFAAGQKVIEQDDPEANNFYVVEAGQLDVYKDYHDGKEAVKVYEYGPGGFFGELALMYNMPRAATVTARTDVTLWVIERATFRHFLMATTKRKREVYQEFLERVPLLQNLDRYERLTVADALTTRNYVPGEVIITQGESGQEFFLLVKGSVKIIKNGEETANSPLNTGAFFGEIALLSDEPRQATITAVGDVQCAVLDRDAFIRLLGPCQDILRRSIESYETIMSKAAPPKTVELSEDVQAYIAVEVKRQVKIALDKHHKQCEKQKKKQEKKEKEKKNGDKKDKKGDKKDKKGDKKDKKGDKKDKKKDKKNKKKK